jgi:NTP pyrophosphatase (non-canonical NTP hydrolase)
MNIEDHRLELYRDVLNEWGERERIDMLYEEIGELIQAVNKFKRNKIKLSDLISEIADVEIMLEQLTVMFDPENGIFVDHVNEEKSRKLTRLNDRLEFHKFNKKNDSI